MVACGGRIANRLYSMISFIRLFSSCLHHENYEATAGGIVGDIREKKTDVTHDPTCGSLVVVGGQRQPRRTTMLPFQHRFLLLKGRTAKTMVPTLDAIRSPIIIRPNKVVRGVLL